MSKYPKLPLEPDSPEARRDFLRKCGRFAAITPPAMTMLLSVAQYRLKRVLPRLAIAKAETRAAISSTNSCLSSSHGLERPGSSCVDGPAPRFVSPAMDAKAKRKVIADMLAKLLTDML